MFRSASKLIEQPKYFIHYKMLRGQRLSGGCNKGKEGDGEEKREGAGRPSYAFRDMVKISGEGNWTYHPLIIEKLIDVVAFNMFSTVCAQLWLEAGRRRRCSCPDLPPPQTNRLLPLHAGGQSAS